MNFVSEYMATYLNELGLVRLPGQSGSLPMLWTDEPNGCPSPYEVKDINAADIQVHILDGSGLPGRRMEAFLKDRILEFTIKAKSTREARYAAKELGEKLEAMFKYKCRFDMAGLDTSHTSTYSALATYPTTVNDNCLNWFLQIRVTYRVSAIGLNVPG